MTDRQLEVRKRDPVVGDEAVVAQPDFEDDALGIQQIEEVLPVRRVGSLRGGQGFLGLRVRNDGPGFRALLVQSFR